MPSLTFSTLNPEPFIPNLSPALQPPAAPLVGSPAAGAAGMAAVLRNSLLTGSSPPGLSSAVNPLSELKNLRSLDVYDAGVEHVWVHGENVWAKAQTDGLLVMQLCALAAPNEA